MVRRLLAGGCRWSTRISITSQLIITLKFIGFQTPNGHECQAVSFFNKVLFSLGRKSEKWTLQGVKNDVPMCRPAAGRARRGPRPSSVNSGRYWLSMVVNGPPMSLEALETLASASLGHRMSFQFSFSDRWGPNWPVSHGERIPSIADRWIVMIWCRMRWIAFFCCCLWCRCCHWSRAGLKPGSGTGRVNVLTGW